MIIKEAQTNKRTLPLLRFLPVSCGLLKLPLKVVKVALPFVVW